MELGCHSALQILGPLSATTPYCVQRGEGRQARALGRNVALAAHLFCPSTHCCPQAPFVPCTSDSARCGRRLEFPGSGHFVSDFTLCAAHISRHRKEAPLAGLVHSLEPCSTTPPFLISPSSTTTSSSWSFGLRPLRLQHTYTTGLVSASSPLYSLHRRPPTQFRAPSAPRPWMTKESRPTPQ